MTLTCISIDRWYAICKPLHFNSTKRRARMTIVCIWFASMITASPDAIFLVTKPLSGDDSNTYVDCTYSWPDTNTQIYQLFVVLLLYITPFVLMTISYTQIVGVLWRNKAVQVCSSSFSSDDDAHRLNKKGQHRNTHNHRHRTTSQPVTSTTPATATTTTPATLTVAPCVSAINCTPQRNYLAHKLSIVSLSQEPTGAAAAANATTTAAVDSAVVVVGGVGENSSSEKTAHCNEQRFCKLIESRRKAAKMLIVIMVMFGLCYLPVHFLNLLRNTIGLPQNDAITIASLVSHWLCYFNSALNPIIYNVMNRNFRDEFSNFIFCRCLRQKQNRSHQLMPQQPQSQPCNYRKMSAKAVATIKQ